MRPVVVSALALLAAAAGAALAQTSVRQPTLAGRYGLTQAACAAKDYFATLSEAAFSLPTYACTGVSFDQVESRGGVETYQVTATACTGEMVVRAKSDRFLIVRTQGRIRFHWADGTRGAELVRCGA